MKNYIPIKAQFLAVLAISFWILGFVTAFGQSTNPAPYCLPNQSYDCANPSTPAWIHNFSFTGTPPPVNPINQVATGCNGNANNYIYYNNLPTLQVTPGNAYTITATTAPAPALPGCGCHGFAVYIDYNQDGDFDDPGEAVANSGSFCSHGNANNFWCTLLGLPDTWTSSITIPALGPNVLCGQTRMRVIVISDATFAPCGNNMYEIQDYDIIIGDPMPPITITPANPTRCAGDPPTQLTATPQVPVTATYTWNPGNLSGSVVDVSPAVTTTYTVVGNRNGCTSSASVVVTVNPSPTVSINPLGPLTLCVGQTQVLTASGASSYTWSPATDLSATNVANPTLTATTPGTRTYTVTGTDANGCTGTATLQVTVNSDLTINITPAGPLSLCVGQTQVLTASGATSYTWSPATDLSATNIANPTLTATTLGTRTYTVEGSDASGCTGTATVQVTVNSDLTVAIAPAGPLTLCEGETQVLTATGATSYTWSPATDLSATNIANPTLTATTLGTRTYTVEGSDASGCTGTATVQVTVNSNPVVNITPTGPLTLCVGETQVLTASGASTYSWSPATDLSATNVANPTLTAATVGTRTYTVTGTAANGCTASATVQVTVNPSPVVNITPAGPLNLCVGQTEVLTASGAASYSWSPATDLSATNIANPTLTATTLGTRTYTVEGTGANGCTASATVQVTVNPNPVVNVAPAGPLTLCVGETQVLTASGASTYSWSPATDLSATNVANPTLTAATVGTRTYTVTGTDGNGCTASATVQVTVNPSPVVNITPAGPLNLCVGQTEVLTASGAASYSWSPATDLSATNIANPTLTATTLGTRTYTVTGTGANGCTASASVQVTVGPSLAVNINPAGPLSLCVGQTQVLGATGATSYTWSPATDLSATNIPNPTLTATTLGTRTYTVEGSNAFGCTGTATVQVTVNASPVVSITPTGPLTLCQGQTEVLTASGASTYSWSPATDLSATNVANPTLTATTLGTRTYTVTGTAANGCTASATVQVTVSPGPTVVINPTGPLTLCANGTRTLVASGATTYSWSPATDLSAVNVANPTLTATTFGSRTYTVTGTQGGCTNSASISVTVDDCTFEFTCTQDEYFEDFDTWDPTTPSTNTCLNGDAVGWSNNNTLRTWYAGIESGTYRFNASDGSCNIGSLYSFGTNGSGERALGTLLSNTNRSRFGARFRNNTGAVITDLIIDYVGEQWRRGSNTGPADRLDFQYSTNATSLATGTWTDFNALDFNSPVTTAPPNALNGNNPANRTALSGTITGLNIAPGQEFWVRWIEFDVTGADDGLAVDDFRMRINTLPQPTSASVATPAPLCANSNITLTATPAPVAPVDYRWYTVPVGGTPVGTGQNLTVSLAAGTYTYYVEAFNTSTGCQSNLPRPSVTFTVNPLPTVNASAVTPICIYQTSQLTATGAVNYTWLPVTNLSDPNINLPVFTPTAAGTFTYTVTGTDAIGCTNSAQTTIVVNDISVLNATATPDILCFDGSTSQFDVTGAASYVWSPASNLNNATIANPVFTPPSANTFTYTVTGTNNFGCTSSAQVTVTVNPIPTLAPTATPNPLCFDGSTSQFNANSNGTSFSWTPAVNLNDATIANPVFTPSATGTFNYDINVSNGLGCTNSARVTVIVNPVPTVNASVSLTNFCQGGNTQLDATGANTYAWTPTTGLSNPSIANPVATPPLGNTTYTVVGTDANGCTNSASVSVSTIDCTYEFTCTQDEYFEDFDSWNPTTPTANTCLGGDAIGWNNANTLPTWYAESVSGPFRFNASDGSCNLAGLYSFGSNGSGDRALGTRRAGGDSYRFGARFRNNTGAVITDLIIDYVGEQWRRQNDLGLPDRLDFQYSTDATSLSTGTWTDFNALDFESPVTTNPPPTARDGNLPANRSVRNGIITGLNILPGQEFWIRWLDFDVAGPDDGLGIDDFRMRVNTLPQPTSITPSSPLCEGTDVTLTGNPTPTAPVTYRWYDVATFGTPLATGNTYTITAPAAGTYTYWAESFNPITGCVSNLPRTPVTFTVNPRPAITASGASPICAYETSQLDAQGGVSYSWTPAANLSNPLIANPVFSPAAAGTVVFTVTGTDANGCTNTATVQVVVNDRPTLIATATPSVLCFGSGTSQLEATGSGTSYVWNPGVGLSNPNVANPILFPFGAGVFDYTVTSTDANGCTNTAQVTVTVNDIPNLVAFAAPNVLCFDGSTAQLEAQGSSVSYVWAPAAGLSNSTIANPVFTPPAPATYDFSVTGTDANGCTNSTQVTVIVHALPTVTITPSVNPLCLGGSAVLAASGATSYTWTPATNLSNATVAAPVFTPTSTGPATYDVRGRDANGCENTASITLPVENCTIVLDCVQDEYFEDFDDWSPNTPTTNTCGTGNLIGWNNGNTIRSWFVDLVSGTERFNSNDGGCTNGGVYAYGNNGSGERALGTLRSGTNHSRFGAVFTNNTGATITQLVIDYTGEQWRRGQNGGPADRLAFEFSTNATSLSTGTWTPFPGLDFTSPVTAAPPNILDGNSPLNRTPVQGIVPVNILPGQTFWIRWDDLDIPGADDGLAIDDLRVRINTLPQPVSVATSLPLCVGTDVTLTANPAPTAPVEYRWFDVPVGGTELAVGTSYTVPAPAAGTYTLYVEAFNTVTNCRSNLPRTPVTFTVNPLPVINAFAPSPICEYQTSQITTTGAVTYAWLPIVGLSDPSIANPVFTPSGPGVFNFTVTGTDANNCVNTATVSITVNGRPTVTATADNPICIYQTSFLTAGGAQFYTWSPAGDLNNPNIATPFFTPPAAGNFTFTVTGTDANFCTNSAQVTVRVVPRPNVQAAANPPSICANATSQLEGTGAVTYAWAPVADLSNPNIALPIFTPPAAGGYQFTVTGTDADGCTNSAQVTVQVNPLPVVNASANPNRICFGLTSQFTATGAVNYLWNPATNLSAANVATPTFTGNNAGIFPYTVTGTNIFGCQATATLTMEVLPQVVLNAPSVSLCEYETRQLNVTGAGTYTWFPALNLSDASIANPTFTPTGPGTYTYTVTGTDVNGCTGSAQVVVTVNPRPTLNATAQSPICIHGTSQFNVTGAATYTWLPPIGLSNPAIANPVFTPTIPGVFPYVVTGTDANGCENTATVLVTVEPRPVILPVAVPPTICITATSQLQAIGAATYTWAPAANLTNPATANPIFTPTLPGTTTFTVTGTTPTGCTNTATVSVTVNPQPNVAAVATPAVICRNQTSQLTANGALTYLWQPGALSGPAVNVTPFNTTTYTVVGADANGCTNSATALVTVNPLPVVTATANPAAICTGQSTTLNSSGAINYQWNPGNLTGASPTATPPVTTQYTVVGTDGNGCTASAATTVTVNPLPVAPSLPVLTICTGETATLTPAIQIGQNRWFTAASGGTLLSTSPSYTTPVLGTAGTYRYYLEVVDGNGCASATRTEGQVWVVNPVVPPPPITGPTSVCSNSSHSYSIPAIPNVTYTWSGLPTGASITQGQGTNQIEINWGAARTGSYTLVVVPNYPCGPGASQQVVIQVSEPPARPLAITGPSQLCIGSTATYNVTTRPSETYTWSLNPPGPVLNPITGPSTTITWNTAGIYALEVQAQNQCGTSPRQSLAVWIATPAVADGGPDATTCGTTAILQAVAPPLPSTGRWRFVAGPVNPTFTQSGTRAIVFGLSAAGVYEFDWEVDNGACPPTSARVRITKRVPPVQPTILTPFQAQCNQETGQIGFVQPTDGTGVWSFMTGPVVAPIDNTGSVIGMTAPGRYRFRYTVSNTCGSSFAEAEIVRENPAPTPFAGADQVVCENPFALLIGSLPPDGYTGKWEYINGPALANVATFGRYGSVVNMSAAGIYTFRYSLISISGICPTVSDVVRVTRVNAPTQPFITGPTQVCGTTAVLRGNIPQVGTPSWSFISGPVTPVINPQNETITITDLTVPGRYTFRWTVESPPCQPLAYDHTIEVSPGTQGGLVQGGGTFCGTQNSGNLLLSGYAGEILGWEIADNPGFGGATLTANTSDIQGFTNLTQTTYFRALVKQGSCPAAYSTTAVVEVLPATVSVNAGPDLTICGSSVALNATVSPANANLSWSIVSQPNGGSASLNPSGATATLTDLASGETVILVEASNACATGSDVVRIRATNNIVAGTLTGDATVCAGQNGGTLNLTGFNGQILRWESSTNGWLTVNTILNTTPAQPYGNLTQTTSYRAVLGGVGCPPVNSNEVTVFVNPQPVANAGPDQAVCTDNFVLVGNPVPNATLTWTQVGGPVTLTPPVNTRILTLSNVTTSGTYTFKYTVTVPGCPPAVDYVNVTVGAGANVGTVTGNATFCGNSGSGTLTLTGFIGSVVRWESSTNNWQTITQHNNPTPSFTYFNLTQTTQFRAVVQVPGCPQAVSNHATVVVNQPPTVAQAPARLDICTDNVQLIGNAPLVGTGEWKFIFGPAIPTVTGNGSFAFVTGLTAVGSYLFEYEIRNDPCPKSVAQTVVTVSQPVAVGPLTADQSVCAGANSGLLTLAQPAGTVLYWETSPDNFVNITTVARTTTAFPFSNLTATTSFRAVVRNGGCAPLTSNAVTVTVFQPTQSGVITGAATVCSNGNTGTLNLVGNVGDVVEWQVSTDNITYTPVANTTTSLTYTNLTQTTWYRVRVKNGPCSEAISAPVRIQVDQLPVGGTASANATVCQGSNFGTLTLTGHTGTVLRWEFSENGIDYNPILNPTTSQSYQNLVNSRQYRAVLGNGVCPEVLSSVVFITVNAPPTPGTITAPATVCAGTNAGSLTLNGNSAGVLRWESTTDGFTFTTIAHTGQTLNWLNLTTTTQFRAVVSDGICPPVSSPLVEITVDQPPVGGVVGADQTVCISNPTGLVTLSGAVGNVRRWEQSTDGGVTWTPIAHTATSYAFANLTQTTQFRAVVGRGVCPDAVSAAARVQVDPLTVAGTLAGAESSCGTPITRTLSLTGNVGDVVAWQSSTDGVNFTNLVGTGNSIEYTTTPQRTWYRAIVRSGVCDPETTATVSVQIFTPSIGGTLTANPAQVCFAQNNGVVNLTGHTGDIVRWERSTDGGITWTTIANTTTIQTFSDLSQTTQYRVVVQNGVCAPAVSTVATVAVSSALQFTTSEVSGCSGLNNLQVVATNAALPVTYSIVPAVAAANQSGLFQNLATGTYTVTAIDANGCTGSVQVTLTGQQTTAQLTSITNVTQNSATVQWLPVPGALTYTLRYRIVGSTDWTVLPNLTTAFRLITGLQQNSTYEIEVAYRCPASNLSPFSTGPVRNFTTLPLAATLCSSAAPISPPGGVYINQIGFNTARINWTGYADAAGYIVSWGIVFTNPATWPQAVVCHPQQHFVLSGLTPGTTYQVRVRTNCTNCTTASQATDKRSDWTTLVNFSTNSFREAQADPVMPFALEVYPNPSQGQFWTRFNLANPEVVEVQLHDAAGREVSRLRWNLEAGEHQLPVSVETAGVYLLEVRIGTLRRFVKVIAQ